MVDILSLGYDTNGNKIVRVKKTGHRLFSIQTNNNLPYCHKFNKVNFETANKNIVLNEIKNYVEKFGTKKQKNIML